MKTRSNLFVVLCTGAAILALAACGSAAAPTAAPAPTVAPAATTAPKPTDAPKPTEAPKPTDAPKPTVASTATTAPKPTDAPTATAAPAATEPVTETASGDVARPSNPGGAGAAIKLKGDVTAGAKVFVDNCKKCHGDAGATGIDNPGSTDGTVPNLNPIDDTLIDKDAVVFATNIDLFIEHGSTPGGKSPTQLMAAFGDKKTLTPQQIADVIAYIISLNPAK